MKINYITGSISTHTGEVSVVATVLDKTDLMGTIKVRSAIGRSSYLVEPGLYAVGKPDMDSNTAST